MMRATTPRRKRRGYHRLRRIEGRERPWQAFGANYIEDRS